MHQIQSPEMDIPATNMQQRLNHVESRTIPASLQRSPRPASGTMTTVERR